MKRWRSSARCISSSWIARSISTERLSIEVVSLVRSTTPFLTWKALRAAWAASRFVLTMGSWDSRNSSVLAASADLRSTFWRT